MFINNKACYEDFGRFIKDRRILAGMSQLEVAEQLQITQSYLSRIEAGKRVLDMVLALNLCAVIGADMTEFMKKYTPSPGDKA